MIALMATSTVIHLRPRLHFLQADRQGSAMGLRGGLACCLPLPAQEFLTQLEAGTEPALRSGSCKPLRKLRASTQDGGLSACCNVCVVWEPPLSDKEERKALYDGGQWTRGLLF